MAGGKREEERDVKRDLHMDPGEDRTISGDWIINVFGISFVALLIGCVICCKRKQSNSPHRRPAVPSPEQSPRYEIGFYPPTPVPGCEHPKPGKPVTDSLVLRLSTSVTLDTSIWNSAKEDTDEESEEDFEEPATKRIDLPSNMSCRNSAEPRKSTTDTTSQGSYVNITSEPTTDHTYIEVLSKEAQVDMAEVTIVQATTDNTTTSREESGPQRSKSLTESWCHSYENITLEESPSSLISEVNLDYVNLP